MNLFIIKLMLEINQAYQKITIGDPLDEKNLMGPLIDQSAVDTLSKRPCQDNQQAAVKFYMAVKCWIVPVFLLNPCSRDAENHWEIVQQETFAPILYLMTYQTLAEAIALAKSSDPRIIFGYYLLIIYNMLNIFYLPRAVTAALPILILAPQARKSAAHLAAKKNRRRS